MTILFLKKKQTNKKQNKKIAASHGDLVRLVVVMSVSPMAAVWSERV